MSATSADRKLRVAFLVLNDTDRDSRVLRTADSAASRGYEVRVFAISSLRCPPGIEVRESGAEILRQGLVPQAAWRAISAGRRFGREEPGTSNAPAEEVSNVGASRRLANRSRAFASAVSMHLAAGAKRRLRARFDRITTTNVVAWKPDLVHAHDANTLRVALNLNQQHGVPFVYDAHELWEERDSLVRGTREESDDRKLLDNATAVAAGIVTVSPSVASWMTDRYDLSVSPTLVRNVPPASGLPDRGRGRLRALAGLKGDESVVVYVGILGPNRGLGETVNALPLLEDNVHLVLLGYSEDAYDKTLADLAQSIGVGARLHFVGSVAPNDVSQTIADADVSLVIIQATYLNDEFCLPNKLFESIRGGLPVLASNLPDIAELVNHYGVGRIIESSSPAEIAAAARALVDQPQSFRDACVTASRELTWEIEVSRLFALYDQILSGSQTTKVSTDH